MNDLPVDDIVQHIEVGNVERADRLDGDGKDVFSGARRAGFPHLGTGRTQCPQHLGAIEALTLAMLAEAHDIERTPAGDVRQIGRPFPARARPEPAGTRPAFAADRRLDT